MRGQTGRIPRLLKANREAICKNLREGMPLITSGSLAGIPKGTLMQWLALGRSAEAKEPYKSFAAEVDGAIEFYKAKLIKTVDTASVKDHRAATWLLERRFTEEFGDPRRGDVNVNVNVQASPEWQALMRRVVDVLRDKHPDALRTLAEEFGHAEVEPRPALPVAAA